MRLSKVGPTMSVAAYGRGMGIHRRPWLLAYVAAALVLGVLDALWLGLAAGRLYRSQIGHLLAPSFAPGPALAFYAVYLVGVVHFVVVPALRSGGLPRAARDGGLLGLVAYATFDLTSMSVMKDFPLVVAVVDIAWGTVLTLVTGVVATWAVRRLRGTAD